MAALRLQSLGELLREITRCTLRLPSLNGPVAALRLRSWDELPKEIYQCRLRLPSLYEPVAALCLQRLQWWGGLLNENTRSASEVPSC